MVVSPGWLRHAAEGRRTLGSLLAGRSPSPRVGVATAAMAVGGGLLWLVHVSHLAPLGQSVHLPWWGIALAYVVVNVLVVHVHLCRHSHTFTLTEIPLVVGFLLAVPNALVQGAVAGTAVALVGVRRQPWPKATFNVALCLAETALAIAVYRALLGGADPQSPQGWGAAVAGAAAGSMFAALAVSAVVAAGDVGSVRRSVVRGVSIALPVLLVNSVVGLAGTRLAAHDLVVTLVLIVPLAVLAVAYRAYLGERQRYERVRLLYQASRDFHRARTVEATVDVLLRQALEMTDAERADLYLLPADSEGRAWHYGLSGETEARVTRCAWTPNDVVTRLLAGGRGLVVRRGRSHDRSLSTQLLGVRDAAVAPLMGEHGPFGCLVVSNRRSDVATFEVEDVAVLETFAAQASISIENSRLEDELHHLAFVDALTGLPNRALFVDRLQHAVHRRRRGEKRPLGVLFLDLDDFKTVNDGLGHLAGDQLLGAVGRRLRDCLRSVDTAARLGGDEFAILVDDVASLEAVTAVAERIMDALRPGFVVDGCELHISASVGIVVAADGTDDAERLLASADLAMYRAKERGKGRYEVFETSLHTTVVERQRLKMDLERGLACEEFTVHYQPIVSLRDGRIVGAEALVRWDHPGHGRLLPDEFVPLAEETGIIDVLGRRVLEEACRAAKRWQTTCPGFVVSVNVAPRQLTERLVDEVARALSASHLEPQLLILEVTERATAQSPAVRAVLRRLRGLGVRLAVDDFGTGYSSLASLRDLPVHILKMAKPFVDGLGRGDDGAAFAAAVVRLGESLGLDVIAEGVERSEQVAHLRGLRCQLAQGFLLGKPMSDCECSELLAEQVGEERVRMRVG